MKVMIIPIVIGTVIKGLVQGLEGLEITGRMETIKTTDYWDWPQYWEEFWWLEETCCHSNSSEKPSANACVKNSQKRMNNNS